MTGLYWEEWEVGAEWVTAGRTVTEADIVNFAGISGASQRGRGDTPR